MDQTLFQRLLLEGEGPRLDYKAAQYRFTGASEDEKAELLKDVLAMANAWGAGDAFILIGVREVKGQPAEPVGIAEHLDDANLQQFVNAKTNKPLIFSYTEFALDPNSTVAVIRIPVQQRPFYLREKYGGLMPTTVYLRRGTSTTIAGPDELVSMGLAAAELAAKPILQLQFADTRGRKAQGTKIEIAGTVLKPLLDDELPDSGIDSESPFGLAAISALNRPNKAYYYELREYVFFTRGMTRIGFVIANTSAVLAQGVRVEFRVPHVEGLFLSASVPPKPSIDLTPLMPELAAFHSDLTVRDVGDQWHVEVDFGAVQPGCERWSGDPVYVGTVKAMTAVFEGRVVGDNLSPMPVRLEIVSDPIVRDMTHADLEEAREDSEDSFD